MKHIVPNEHDAEPLHFDDGPTPEPPREASSHKHTEELMLEVEEPNDQLFEGFMRADGHIYKRETTFEGRAKTPRTTKTYVCSDIKLLGKGATPDGEWGKLIGFKDPFGMRRLIVIPFRHLAGDGKDARSILLSNSIMTATDKPGREALAQLLAFGGRDTIYYLADRLGWHRGHFVLPAGVISPPDPEHMVAYDQHGGEHPFRSKGDLAEWQRVCKIVQSIPYAVLAISAAFVGPLLQLMDAESGGIHFYGPSSRGKTTYARLAGSVWGAPDEIVRPWNATINGIEARAAEASDTLLILDEIGQSDASSTKSDIAKITYMLANGVGKARADKNGGLQHGSSWRVLAISTGEHPISDLVRDHHGASRMTGGVGVRMIDLPIHPKNASLSESHDNSESAGQVIDTARSVISDHYGHAGPAFVRRLIAEPEIAIEKVQRSISRFMEMAGGNADDPQVTRVAKRIALIVAAGELAEEYGILTWEPGSLEGFGLIALTAWLEERGSRSSLEELNAMKTVRLFLETHGEARFRPVNAIEEDDCDVDGREVERPIINRAGFRTTTKDGDSVWYIFPEVWRSEVCKGQNPQLVAKVLKERGVLMSGEERHYAKKVRIPGMANSSRFYCISAKIFEESNLD
ncbi:DUF927 domain-containing protein [Paracoccus sp. R12_1]|uniref:DUF927 domain-containing protein n=1 Tax=unclassified Paracoccus (in: a-proteobacteria) TaxID=2688777 RepID=UPI001ADAAA83|nr:MULTISPECIES: DUF927 domain-containing protein [unclassified Paracoccus (in: a-proteobacteria)]MBO9454631.1 DUF927 domain-containing protein [Paracoccus sp. R12_2]MBO9486185.1 DUF927 domain-containing protein [Paracoccus sp. R12_1]